MKKLTKVFLILAALVGIVFSLCVFSLFYIVPFLTDALQSNWNEYPQLNFAFAVYIVVVGFLFFALLIYAVLMPLSARFLVVKNEKGELRCSKKTVESISRLSFMDLTEIGQSEVKVILGKNPNKTKIFVTLSSDDVGKLSAVTETVQNRVQEALKASLDLTVKSVSIKIVESNPATSDKIVYNKDIKEEEAVPEGDTV